jgi:hypothetical protein
MYNFVLLLVSKNNNKHISQNWQKIAILSFYKSNDGLKEVELKLLKEIKGFEVCKEEKETELRNKQFKEMEEANMKGHQLDNIVNRHIIELTKFSKENEEDLLKILDQQRDIYLKSIEDCFQKFFDSIDSSHIIYNSENKLIKLMLKENELVIKNNFLDKNKQKQQEVKKQEEILYHSKLNFGVFNKIRLNIFYCVVKDHINNDIKKLVMPIINSKTMID